MSKEISIIKTEGFDYPCLGCYISVNERLYDVVTPLNEDNETNTVSIPNYGMLKLTVKTMGKQENLLGSVSFLLDSDIFEGRCWLPLSSSSENSQI